MKQKKQFLKAVKSKQPFNKGKQCRSNQTDDVRHLVQQEPSQHATDRAVTAFVNRPSLESRAHGSVF